MLLWPQTVCQHSALCQRRMFARAHVLLNYLEVTLKAYCEGHQTSVLNWDSVLKNGVRHHKSILRNRTRCDQSVFPPKSPVFYRRCWLSLGGATGAKSTIIQVALPVRSRHTVSRCEFPSPFVQPSSDDHTCPAAGWHRMMALKTSVYAIWVSVVARIIIGHRSSVSAVLLESNRIK